MEVKSWWEKPITENPQEKGLLIALPRIVKHLPPAIHWLKGQQNVLLWGLKNSTVTRYCPLTVSHPFGERYFYLVLALKDVDACFWYGIERDLGLRVKFMEVFKIPPPIGRNTYGSILMFFVFLQEWNTAVHGRSNNFSQSSPILSDMPPTTRKMDKKSGQRLGIVKICRCHSWYIYHPNRSWLCPGWRTVKLLCFRLGSCMLVAFKIRCHKNREFFPNKKSLPVFFEVWNTPSFMTTVCKPSNQIPPSPPFFFSGVFFPTALDIFSGVWQGFSKRVFSHRILKLTSPGRWQSRMPWWWIPRNFVKLPWLILLQPPWDAPRVRVKQG